MQKTATIFFSLMLLSVSARAGEAFDVLLVRHEAQGGIYELALARLA